MSKRFKAGDKVKVEGKGKAIFTIVSEYQHKTDDGWFMRDEDGKHRVFLDSQVLG